MRIIAVKPLRDFGKRHADAAAPLRAWISEVEAQDWNSPADVKRKYGSASILKDGRCVFNIGGGKNRLVVRIVYQCHIVYIRFIGTHQEYNGIDAEKA